VVVPDFRAAHAGEKALRVIGAGIVELVGFLVIDPLHDEATMKRVPRVRLVSVDFSSVGYLAANAVERFAFRLERSGES
jgi:hypothetical protein